MVKFSFLLFSDEAQNKYSEQKGMTNKWDVTVTKCNEMLTINILFSSQVRYLWVRWGCDIRLTNIFQ